MHLVLVVGIAEALREGELQLVLAEMLLHSLQPVQEALVVGHALRWQHWHHIIVLHLIQSQKLSYKVAEVLQVRDWKPVQARAAQSYQGWCVMHRSGIEVSAPFKKYFAAQHIRQRRFSKLP